MISRRHVLAAFAAIPVVALPVSSSALTDQSARALINTVVNEINSVISSGQSNAKIYAQFERIFRRYADTSYVAAYAMGAEARRATASQKSAFSDAYISYLSRKYGRRFREFEGGRLEVQSVVKSKNAFEVQTTAFLRGQSPFEVSFLVSDRTGKDLFFNLYIEGINMGLTERSEIGAMLDARRGNIDAMIADLRSAS